MTREELREKAIEKLKTAMADEISENEAKKTIMEISSMYSSYLSGCFSPFSRLEPTFIASSLIVLGKAMFDSLDEYSKEVANMIIDSGVVVAHRKAVDKE